MDRNPLNALVAAVTLTSTHIRTTAGISRSQHASNIRRDSKEYLDTMACDLNKWRSNYLIRARRCYPTFQHVLAQPALGKQVYRDVISVKDDARKS